MELKTSNEVADGKVLDLGNFGHVEDVPAVGQWPEPAKFPWFGVEVRVNPALSDTALVDMIETAGELEDTDPQAAIVIKDFVREVIHPDDFADFWKLGKAHGYQTAEFAECAARIIEAVTGDPTQESQDSSNGRLPTATKSLVVSSKVERTVEELEGEGRADLAEFFVIAQEHGASR